MKVSGIKFKLSDYDKLTNVLKIGTAVLQLIMPSQY